MAAALLVSGFQTSDKIDRKQLRDMLSQLGYELKDIEKTEGKEKYSFTFSRGGLDIPVGAEISPSGSYIWYTVNLGEVPSGEKSLELLRKNSEIQPCFFYVTKSSSRLMMALPIENRNVTNAILRLRAEKIVDDVANSKSVWQK